MVLILWTPLKNMAKRNKKSITDLLGKKSNKPDLDNINAIAEKIHNDKVEEPAKTKPAPIKADIANRTKRISLNAPLELYLGIQREATLQGKPMMQYILEVVAKDLETKS